MPTQKKKAILFLGGARKRLKPKASKASPKTTPEMPPTPSVQPDEPVREEVRGFEKMRNKVAVLVLSLAAVIAIGNAHLIASEPDEAAFCSQGIEKRVDRRIGDYRVNISYAGDRMCQRLEIRKAGQVVFRDEGIDNHYFLGNEDGGGDRRAILHLTGRGSQLVVKKWTGGAHCCNSLLVFDLGSQFREISEVYAGNFDADIVDLDRDGLPEIRVWGDFLAYRFSCFAYSAASEVVLKYVDGKYSVAPGLMKRSAPSWRSLRTRIARWRRALRASSDPKEPPPPFIQAMTDLIFTGHEGKAFELVDRVWPADVAGKVDFLASYREALGESRYYGEFKAKESDHH